MRTVPLLLAAMLAAASGLALGQAASPAAPAEDHSAHHPPAAAAPAPATPAADRHAEQMKKMREMHERLRAASAPAERQALLAEQARLMQSSMQAMRDMRMHRGGEHGAMPMHDAMAKRMEMMESMLQMLVDRASGGAAVTP